MFIKFMPQRRDDKLVLENMGDRLIVNGVSYDFSPLPEGATLPAEAVDSDLFCGPVERVNGEIHLTLILPHGANPSQSVAFPDPITVMENGIVEVPK